MGFMERNEAGREDMMQDLTLDAVVLVVVR